MRLNLLKILNFSGGKLMKVFKSFKKLNKNYSIVIIPYTNDKVKRLSLKAPAVKLIIVLFFVSVVVLTALLYPNKSDSERITIQEVQASNEELKQQIQYLNEVIKHQNDSLSLSSAKLEQLKLENSEAKAKIEDFVKLYNDITEEYITETSRGAAAARNNSRAILDIKKLNNLVQELNKSFNNDDNLSVQLNESNKKLDKYVAALPTFIPAKGEITSPFGMRNHPIEKVFKAHQGVDINASKGDPIYAAAAGIVEFAGYSKGYGYNVKIDHQNGFRTIYGHSSKLLVKKGDKVAKGQKIALVGSTGNSTGPHLHFEIRIGNTPVDPTEYLNFGN